MPRVGSVPAGRSCSTTAVPTWAGTPPPAVYAGWPRPLTDPVSYGGSAADAFDVVCPSLPGFGFSGKPARAGWGVERIAAAWAQLMARLGYQRYGAEGSDWGTSISTSIGQQDPGGRGAGQEIAARTSSATFFSTTRLHFLSAYDTGHRSPSSRFAASWKPRVE